MERDHVHPENGGDDYFFKFLEDEFFTCFKLSARLNFFLRAPLASSHTLSSPAPYPDATELQRFCSEGEGCHDGCPKCAEVGGVLGCGLVSSRHSFSTG